MQKKKSYSFAKKKKKKKATGFAHLQALSWETDLWVKLGEHWFYRKKHKILEGKSVFKGALDKYNIIL